MYKTLDNFPVNKVNSNLQYLHIYRTSRHVSSSYVLSTYQINYRILPTIRIVNRKFKNFRQIYLKSSNLIIQSTRHGRKKKKINKCDNRRSKGARTTQFIGVNAHVDYSSKRASYRRQESEREREFLVYRGRASLTRNWRNAMVVAQPSGVDRFNSGAYGLEIRPESRHPPFSNPVRHY